MAGVALPYWDSVLESHLPDPSDSVLWTPEFMGSISGTVDGPFADFPVMPSCHSFGSTVKRDANIGGNWLFREADITHATSKANFPALASDPRFEMDHGGIHQFFKGHMSDLNCATADPLFYLHHSFVDCVFQEFLNSSPSDPTSYPSNARGGFHHQSWAAMTPCLGINNAVGLDVSRYQHYTYKPKPSSSTCKKNNDCGNKYALWCDTRLDPPKCRAKVKTGGNCTGLPDAACQPCRKQLAHKCVDNVCLCI